MEDRLLPAAPAGGLLPVALDGRAVLELLARARGRRVAVVGDLILDHYLYGEPVRISREAPVLILRYREEEVRPGGAANAAANACALGGQVSVVGLVGDDPAADRLEALLAARGIEHRLVRDPGRPTTVKTRIVAAGRQAARQQVLRVDRWEAGAPPDELQRQLAEAARRAVEQADAVILSEYGGGGLTSRVIEAVLEVCQRRGVPAVADSRYRLLEFRGVYGATPNVPEAEQVLGRPLRGEGDMVRAGRELLERLQARLLVLTRGDEGMSVFLAGGDRRALRLLPYRPREVYDVSGAGDTVVAAVALGLACGEEQALAGCLLADVAAGLVVAKPGVATPDMEELQQAVAGWVPEAFEYGPTGQPPVGADRKRAAQGERGRRER